MGQLNKRRYDDTIEEPRDTITNIRNDQNLEVILRRLIQRIEYLDDLQNTFDVDIRTSAKTKRE